MEISLNEIQKLKSLAQQCRKDVLKMVRLSGEGHLGASFSCMEILTTLYYGIMNINPSRPNWVERDQFILSKGHACFAQYALLARKGYFPIEWLYKIGIKNDKNNIFSGHPDRDKIPGIDVSTGSLGHGLSIGTGIALASKKDNQTKKIFVLLGDGECQEGSVWEAAMFASMYKLDNLIAIIDANTLQAIARVEDTISMEPFIDKWKSFGWQAFEVDGHNCGELLETMMTLPKKEGLPTAIIARTIKGKGVSFMENEIMWHARSVTEEEYQKAISEIDRSIK